MVKKIGDKKIGGVKSTTETSHVEGTGAVSGVSGVKPTAGVGGVGKSGGVGRRRATRIMSLKEREELFQMINEEADKLIEAGAIPASQRDVVKNAVKMAVDAGLIDEEDEKKK